MKKSNEKLGDCGIEWSSVARIGDTCFQDHGLNFLFGKGHKNILAFKAASRLRR